MDLPFIISDIGSNWRRSDEPKEQLAYCKLAIEAAKEAAVSAVKFQYFTHRELTGFPGDDTYALSESFLNPLKEYADKVGIEFMVTAFSEAGYERVNPLVSKHKIASCENRHPGIIKLLKDFKKPTFISLGGITEDDLNRAQGYPHFIPLECVINYPALERDYNLTYLPQYFGEDAEWGLSDHCLSPVLTLLAIGKGARYFEVHFDPFSDMPVTPDTPVSLSRDGLKNYVSQIRQAVKFLEPRAKSISEAELINVRRYKRSFIARKDIKAGEAFETGVNFGVLRPTYPVVPMDPLTHHYPHGRIAERDYKAGEQIT